MAVVVATQGCVASSGLQYGLSGVVLRNEATLLVWYFASPPRGGSGQSCAGKYVLQHV